MLFIFAPQHLALSLVGSLYSWNQLRLTLYRSFSLEPYPEFWALLEEMINLDSPWGVNSSTQIYPQVTIVTGDDDSIGNFSQYLLSTFYMSNEHVAYLTTVPFQVSISSNKLEPTFPASWCRLSCEQEELEVKAFIFGSFLVGLDTQSKFFLRCPNAQ